MHIETEAPKTIETAAGVQFSGAMRRTVNGRLNLTRALLIGPLSILSGVNMRKPEEPDASTTVIASTSFGWRGRLAFLKNLTEA